MHYPTGKGSAQQHTVTRAGITQHQSKVWLHERSFWQTVTRIPLFWVQLREGPCAIITAGQRANLGVWHQVLQLMLCDRSRGASKQPHTVRWPCRAPLWWEHSLHMPTHGHFTHCAWHYIPCSCLLNLLYCCETKSIQLLCTAVLQGIRMPRTLGKQAQ